MMEQFLVTLGFTLTCRLVKSILCQESSGSGWVGDSPQTNPNSGVLILDGSVFVTFLSKSLCDTA